MKELFLLDPEVTFLNHGSFGAAPRAVFERYQAWQRELEREPVDFIARRLNGILSEARAELGAFVGADGDDLTFVQNATTGVNVAARALGLGPEDEVLTTNLEYGACVMTWQRLCTLVEAPVGELFEHVTERTKAVFVSHITSETALLLPVEEIVREARSRGLTTIVDGAHAVAQVDLDLDALGADFYSGNCHKWLCAPKGAGFLHVRPEWQERVDGVITSWGYEEPATFISRTERQGTRDSSAYLTVPTAIEFAREHDVRERCVALCREARRDLCALLGTDPIAPEEMVLQMASVRLPARDPDLSQRLFDEHRVEIPVSHDGTLLRISVAPYTERADVDRLLEALATELHH
ncbi:MAG TPA: aminotransferase class V-fold PLP-dependent enzyme [Gaiellaceae bacterium]|nr:aminotransferase class V-fold PLP-dependent enzyme [Gaiellaceae bacterium]